MWTVYVIGLILVESPAYAEFGFDEKYERDYNIFNPASKYAPDNPLNPSNQYNPNTPFEPLNRTR